jgi:hypothetical protein
MRIILFFLAFICLQLNAQDQNKTALTAGSEFLKNNETSQSITANKTTVVFTVADRSEVPILNSVKSQYNTTKPGMPNALVYVLVFLLIAIALYFITAKNKARLKTTINIENEEDGQRKKELWKAMAEPEAGE